MIVIGVDPGKITGIAIWQSPQELEKTIGMRAWTVTEVGNTQVLPTIRWLLRGRKPTAIACERFVQGTGRRAMSFQGDALHISGEVSGLAQELGCPFVRQLAGPAKKIAQDDVLRRLGCYTVSNDGHANDGCRQVIRYLADHHPDVFAELLGI